MVTDEAREDQTNIEISVNKAIPYRWKRASSLYRSLLRKNFWGYLHTKVFGFLRLFHSPPPRPSFCRDACWVPHVKFCRHFHQTCLRKLNLRHSHKLQHTWSLLLSMVSLKFWNELLKSELESLNFGASNCLSILNGTMTTEIKHLRNEGCFIIMHSPSTRS